MKKPEMYWCENCEQREATIETDDMVALCDTCMAEIRPNATNPPTTEKQSDEPSS
jgi:hypothetical protein